MKIPKQIDTLLFFPLQMMTFISSENVSELLVSWQKHASGWTWDALGKQTEFTFCGVYFDLCAIWL